MRRAPNFLARFVRSPLAEAHTTIRILLDRQFSTLVDGGDDADDLRAMVAEADPAVQSARLEHAAGIQLGVDRTGDDGFAIEPHLVTLTSVAT